MSKSDTTLEEIMEEASVSTILTAIERIRFNPQRLAEFERAIAENAPGVGDATEFLDYLIWRAGGRSQ